MAILLMVRAGKTCEVTDSVTGQPVLPCRVLRVTASGTDSREDRLAVEEPLEIRLRWQHGAAWQEEPLTITMRTPGHDAELATGLLFSEGIVTQAGQIVALTTGENSNTLTVQLAAGHQLDLKRFQRHFYSTSSCGVCGKMAMESLRLLHEPQLSAGSPCVSAATLQQMPDTLRAAQPLFAQTGGVHAAGLFDAQGALLLLREDIGRHNAVDKLIGACRAGNAISLHDKVLVVSGRAGFELVQKALVADIAVMASVGAPSSLAVEMAQAHGMTLVGFLKRDSLNCYSGEERLVG